MPCREALRPFPALLVRPLRPGRVPVPCPSPALPLRVPGPVPRRLRPALGPGILWGTSALLLPQLPRALGLVLRRLGLLQQLLLRELPWLRLPRLPRGRLRLLRPLLPPRPLEPLQALHR